MINRKNTIEISNVTLANWHNCLTYLEQLNQPDVLLVPACKECCPPRYLSLIANNTDTYIGKKEKSWHELFNLKMCRRLCMPTFPVPLCSPICVESSLPHHLNPVVHVFVNSSLSFHRIKYCHLIKQGICTISTSYHTLIISFVLHLPSLTLLSLFTMFSILLLYSLPTELTLHIPSITIVTSISALQLLGTFFSHFQGIIPFPSFWPFPPGQLLDMQPLPTVPFVHSRNHYFF